MCSVWCTINMVSSRRLEGRSISSAKDARVLLMTATLTGKGAVPTAFLRTHTNPMNTLASTEKNKAELRTLRANVLNVETGLNNTCISQNISKFGQTD